MHTLSACGVGPQFLSLPVSGGFGKPGRATVGAEAFTAGLGGVDLAFGEAEIVSDFVPDSIDDDAFEFSLAAGHLFMRTLEDADAVGAVEPGVSGGAFGAGPAFVKAEEVGVGADGFDDNHQILHVGAEARRQAGDGAVDERIEGFWCDPYGHFARIERKRRAAQSPLPL